MVPEEDCFRDFTIFLWTLSVERRDPLDWPGAELTVERAAVHHGWFVGDVDSWLVELEAERAASCAS